MRSLLISVAMLLVALGLAGLTFLPPLDHRTPAVTVEVMDPSLQGYAEAWRAEVSRRFPDAVVILAHGGNFAGDQWICSALMFGRYSTVQDAVRFEQARYPGRTIVVLCCNPGHLKLGIPGVFYSNDSVWCVPDRAAQSDGPEDSRLLQATRPTTAPATQPATQPAGPPAPPAPPAPPVIVTHETLKYVFIPTPKTRWEESPAVVGNVFELVED